jgi:hypothetical protein
MPSAIFMIRHFVQFYKQDLRKLNSDAYTLMYKDDMSVFRHACPACGAEGSLSEHASYGRDLVLAGDAAVYRKIRISRLRCTCGRTHAVLPELIVPYRSYSLLFILTALKTYFFRNILGKTVSDIALEYGTAVSTLYGWKKLFLEHRGLLLGALAAVTETLEMFFSVLSSPPCSASERLCDFHARFGFSFMQKPANTS